MSFDVEHKQWLKDHLKRRRGERLDALRRGHEFGSQLFAERIWWQLVGHFNGLHPEYEVKDWRGRSYFVDYMWIVGGYRFVFEIMDFGSHGKDRSKYRRDMNRELYLRVQGCSVINISLDELRDNPEFVLSSLRSILSPHMAAEERMRGKRDERLFCKTERDLMHVAIRNNRILYPGEAAQELELHTMTVIKYCRRLVDKGKFRAVARGKSQKIIYYEYVGAIHGPDLI